MCSPRTWFIAALVVGLSAQQWIQSRSSTMMYLGEMKQPTTTATKGVGSVAVVLPSSMSSDLIDKASVGKAAAVKKKTTPTSSKKPVVCTPSCNCTNSLKYFQPTKKWKPEDLYYIAISPSAAAAVVSTTENTTGAVTAVQQQDVIHQDDEAVCIWKGTKIHTHFPHWLEIMYKCWSWWTIHKDTYPQAVLEIHSASIRFWHIWESRLQSSPLAEGLWKHMQEKLDVKVVFQPVTSTVMNATAVPPLQPPPPRQRKQKRGTPRSTRAILIFNDEMFLPWFPNVETARALRDSVVERLFPGRALSGCNLVRNNTGPQALKPSTVNGTSMARIGVLNRLGTRHLSNYKEIVDELQALVSTPVSYKTFEGVSFEEQIDFFSSIDIVVSPHGAQFSGVTFMPSCGAYLELLPKYYHIHDYFGSLAHSANLTAGYLYLSDGDPAEEAQRTRTDKEFRVRARKWSLCPPVSSVVSSVRALLDKWESCCSSQR